MAALVNFTRKLGKQPIVDLIKIYKAKCISTAKYGAGIWGYADVQPLQLVENVFLRYLLAVPNSTASYICHTELGLPYVSDLIKIQPVLLWHKIWSSTTISFNRDVINECLKLQRVSRIPWLNYVKNVMADLGCREYFSNLASITLISRKVLKTACMDLLETIRFSTDTKPSVRETQLLLIQPGVQPYLATVKGSYDRMLLTRFRLGNFYRMIQFPNINDWSWFLCPSPCDDTSTQAIIHILFFL